MCGNSRLAGRGTVEITIEKSDGSTFQAEAEVDIDGYSAPVTAGNSAKLVTNGAYDRAKLNTVNQAVIKSSTPFLPHNRVQV
ncbi:hypothetical protein DY000_02042954 [Brassica cretica]|uniref:Uncharacterized protein n=1 Tax=Brassica cretica TaxID=69181 RepID=A0ABQ7BPP2_BRACR|nr:hypothetical protein DY000_02042954 [Brassica cretica]